MEGWDLLREEQPPKTLANKDYVSQVAYDGERITARGAVLIGVTEFDSPHIQNLPTPLRDVQLLEERLRRYNVDYITVLSSAQRDKIRKPTAENIIRAIREMRQQLGPSGLLQVFISTHGVVSDGALRLIPSDFDPYTKTNSLHVDDLSQFICPASGGRGILTVDYGSHYVETMRSFGDVDVDQPVPLPKALPGYAFMCSPPRMPSSFCSRYASMFDELIERRLPICANSVFAIFKRHAQRWMGTTSNLMILLSDKSPEAPSGKIPLFDWSYVVNSDRSVTYTVNISQSVPQNAPLPDPKSLCQQLKQRVLPMKVQHLVTEDQRRFIIKVSGGHPSRGPREDKNHFSREISAICDELRLPRVSVVKAWFGKIICSTSAAGFETAFRAFNSFRTLKSSMTSDPPNIEYIGLLCRAEITSSYNAHLQMDECCRKRLMEPQTGLIIEELGFDQTVSHTVAPHHDHHEEMLHHQRPQTPPAAQVSEWVVNSIPPPASPSDEGSPMLTNVSLQPWGGPQAVPQPNSNKPAHTYPSKDFSSDIDRLQSALKLERSERINAVDSLQNQINNSLSRGGGGGSSLDNQMMQNTISQLVAGQESMNSKFMQMDEKYRELENKYQQERQEVRELKEWQQRASSKSPTRGGACLEVSNEDWLNYQDQLKLLQIQLRDVQSSVPNYSSSRPVEVPSKNISTPRTSAATVQLERQLQEQKAQVDKLAADLSSLQQQFGASNQSVRFDGVPAPSMSGASPSIEDVRMLRQRIERMESLDDAAERSHIGSKIDQLQNVVDRLVNANSRPGDGDIRKLYNDMMLDDIDAQLQGRIPSQSGDLKGGVFTPQFGAPVYLPAGLKSAIQGMVGGMISTVKEQIERWASGQIGTQREQLSALNAATAEQLLGVQAKIRQLEQSGFDHFRDRSTRPGEGDADAHSRELSANAAAITGLEKSIQLIQTTLSSYSSRLQGLEQGVDSNISDLQANGTDLRERLDTAVQRINQTALDLDQKVMKELTDALARVTVADQRINHLDSRLSEDGERIHRLEDRIELSTRQLQERIDDQGQRLFDTDRKLTTSLDDKVAIMRQIAEVAEKGTIDLERKWHDSESQLKSQLRAALQQHIEGLEEVLHSMKVDIKGCEDRTNVMETIVGECKVAGSLIDQKNQMIEKTVEALRSGFETYVHDGTVHIMQAQNEKMEELRLKLAQELDTFDGQIKNLEADRKYTDEQLANALEKIQIGLANQPSNDRVDRALAVLDEQKIRPAMEAASRSYELGHELQNVISRLDQLSDVVRDTTRDSKAQSEEQSQRAVEIRMLKDQIGLLREQMQQNQHGGGMDTSGVDGRIREVERRTEDLSRAAETFFDSHDKMRELKDQFELLKLQVQNLGSGAGGAKGEPAGLSSADAMKIDELLAEVHDRMAQTESNLEGLKGECASLRTKISLKDSSEESSGDMMNKSLRKTLNEVRKELGDLKGWKNGKEKKDFVQIQTNSTEISVIKKDLAELKNSFDNYKAGVDD